MYVFTFCLCSVFSEREEEEKVLEAFEQAQYLVEDLDHARGITHTHTHTINCWRKQLTGNGWKSFKLQC